MKRSDKIRAYERGVSEALVRAPIAVLSRLAERGARVAGAVSNAPDTVSGSVVALATLGALHSGPDGRPASAPRFGRSSVGPSSPGPAMRHTDKAVTGALVRPGQRARNDAHAGNSARFAIAQADREVARRARVRAIVDALPQGNAKERKRARSLARLLAREGR